MFIFYKALLLMLITIEMFKLLMAVILFHEGKQSQLKPVHVITPAILLLTFVGKKKIIL